MKTKLYTLITGSSEGFGRELAIECARRKMNLILVSLPDSGLNDLAKFIMQTYLVDVVTLEKDLCLEENCISLYQEIEQMNLAVNVLINNVGLGSTMFFKEGNINFYQKQLKLNVMATTVLTSLFLGMLEENKPSHILNVSSLSCFFFLAKKQVYGASKSYVYSFSKSLRSDLKFDNINVSVVCPGGMNTNPTTINTNNSLHWLAKKSIMNPDEVAEIAIRGMLNRKEIIIPGKMNKIFLLINKLLPSFVIKMIADSHINKFKSYNIGRLNRELLTQRAS